MAIVGDEIGSVYGITVVNERFGGSLGWDVGRSVVSGLHKDVGVEVGSGENGRVGFKVGGGDDSENYSSFSKYVKYEFNVKFYYSVCLDVYIDFDAKSNRSIVVEV